jgi:tRNA A-37 threonylcarbamoyl transferase component Bud32
MTETRLCPQCGSRMPADAPEGLCPKCLLAERTSTAATEPPRSGVSSGYQGHFTAPTPEELADLFPQLEILELLGQGGMGAVYKARQPGLDRFVALKILPPEAVRDPAFAERFSREARALAKLNHPNIVSVYDSGKAGDLYYFIMEFIDGVNLRQLIRTGHILPREALQIVPQICDALQFAHDEGIVHRDIKPENILLDKRGRVKIADFGIAKLLGSKAVEYTLTGPWQVMGTAHYMAPEQMAKPQEVDHRADIYSLGVVFYELLTGQLPIGRFAPPSKKVEIDVRLDQIVLRALESEPERRYQHVSDVKTEVETIVGKLPPEVMRRFGYEYKSKTTVFGWPVVHIATGMDPMTGRKRIAKGIIAIGDIALGIFAFGGCAFGGLAFGGFSLGLFSIGGMAIGLLVAFGGGAIGALAVGGGALGLIAVGGGAVGYYATGGGAYGVHPLGANAQDPAAKAFFDWFPINSRFVLENMGYMGVAMGLFMAVSFITIMILQYRSNRAKAT